MNNSYESKHISKLRKKYLIEPKFQLMLVLINLLTLLLAAAIFITAFYLAFENLRTMGIASGLPQGDTYFSFIDMQFSLLMKKILFGVGLALLVGCVLTLYLSHKMIGPLLRLRKFFTQIKESGEVTPLCFRKNDYLSDLPAIINQALEVIRKNKK
ncbi:MAG: hypothetical protein HQK50_02835 [Oligoflexia bacterium]|nr:hypothetical protein [Oligoflexia bacterium]MBF0364477.1 hypothetical protein [Oligoflexia bacterium]